MKATKKSILVIGLLSGFIFLYASCEHHTKPGWVYMPDMYYSRAYQSYGTNVFFDDSMNARLPVKGTIPKYVGQMDHENSYMPFHYENTPEDYKRAGMELKNPLEMSKENIEQGQHNFVIYCAICHGESGEANGTIVKNGKFPPPPSYFDPTIIALPEGSRFFSVHYGKNLMGSYASQLSQKQIWQVLTYIKSMQIDYIAKNDTTKNKAAIVVGGVPIVNAASANPSNNSKK